MPRYALQKDNGWFVARPGSRGSYTLYLQSARVFPTREAAEADRCGNETVVDLDALFDAIR